MVDLSKFQTPLNYNVRKANIDDASSIAAVHIQSWQETYKGIVSSSYLSSLSHEYFFYGRKKILSKNEQGNFVVTHNDHVVGFCDVGPLHDQYQPSYCKSEIYAIYLLQEHHGLGLGKAMFSVARSWLQQNHSNSFFICALKSNIKARSFYQQQGGKMLEKEFLCTLGDEDYPEVVYYFN